MSYVSRKAVNMHQGQLNVSLLDARNMIHEQFPQYACETIKRLVQNAGTVNCIFRVGIRATARFAFQREFEQDVFTRLLRAEAAAMTEFADNCPFPCPRPIGIGHPSPAYPLPWSIQTWVEGETNTPSGLAHSHTFALDIAQLIASLRSVDVSGRVFADHNRGGRLCDHDTWMETCLSNSHGLLEVPRLRALWSFFRSLPQSEGPDVMSHRDLTPMNVLVQGEHLVGVLDTGTFGPADRALDLVAVWHMLEKDQREVVRTILAIPEIEWKRGAAWAFEQAMGLVWYYEQSNPTMAAFGRCTLKRILDDDDLNSQYGRKR